MNKRCLLSCALFLCLVMSCAATPISNYEYPLPLPPASASAEQSMQNYAVTLVKGTPAQIAAFYQPDGQLLLSGTAPLTGPKEVEAFLAPSVKQAKVTHVFVHTDRVIEAKTYTVLFGTYIQTYMSMGGNEQAVAGRYASEWQQERRGGWKIVRLMMQPGPPPEISDPEHP